MNKTLRNVHWWTKERGKNGQEENHTVGCSCGIEEELKSLFMRVKEECEKPGLKFNIQKSKIMASSPIISWQIGGKKVEIATDFIFLGSKITTDADCNHQNKRCLHFGRKAMTSMLC